MPSVLWRCWLGGRKGIRPVKTEWWGAGMVICLERGADLHMAQLMPLPLTVSCFSKIQIGFTLLVPAHRGSPGQRAVKRVCVCVCVCVCVSLSHRCSQSSRDAEARDQWTRRDDLLPISSVHVLWTNLKAAFTPHGAVAFSGERGFIPRRVVVKTKQHAPRHSTLWTQLNSRISSMHPQSYMYW